MDHVWALNAVSTPPVLPSSLEIGYPDDQTSIGTTPGAWWYYMITEEIRNTITTAGLTPTAGVVTQLSAAIVAIAQSSVGALVNKPARVIDTVGVSMTGLQTVDSVSLVNGDRVLRNVGNAASNGIWLVNSAGAWTRPADYLNGATILEGDMYEVTEGTTNSTTVWALHSVVGENVIVGTTASQYTNITGAVTASINAINNSLSTTIAANAAFASVTYAPINNATHTGVLSAPTVVVTGALTATTTALTSTGLTNTLKITDTGVNGANIQLVGDGSTTPNKFIRASGGNFQILNSAYTAVILSINDSGVVTCASNNQPLYVNSNNSANQKITLANNGATVGYIGASATSQFSTYNTSSAIGFSVDQLGNGTFTGSVVVTNLTTTAAIYNSAVNAGMEHGNTTTANNPYIDFHSSGNANDYDSRFIANGGTTNGTGSLGFAGAQFTINGLTTPLIVNSTSSSNIKLAFQEAGVNQGFIGAAPTMSFYAINKTNTSYTFSVDQTGNGSFMGSVTAGSNISASGTFNSGGLAELGSAVTQAAPSATNIPSTASTYMGGAGGNGLFVGQYPTSNMTWIQASFNNPTTATYHMSLQPLGGCVGIGTGSVAPVSCLQLNGAVSAGGSTIGASIGQFQASCGTGNTWYNAGLRNDGNSVYLLSSSVVTTQAAAANAVYNALRPLSWSLSNGAVSIDGTGAGTTFGGILSTTGITVNTSGNGLLVTGSSSGNIAAVIANSNAAGFTQLGLQSAGTNGNKSIRSNGLNGNFELVNSAYTNVIFSVSDAGNTYTKGTTFLSNGSAIAPSLTFTNEPVQDTGLYWGGDGFINVSNNGVYSGQFTNDHSLVMVNNITTTTGEFIGNGGGLTGTATNLTAQNAISANYATTSGNANTLGGSTLAQIESLITNSGIGVGQTWQDKTLNYVPGFTNYNITGRSIEVLLIAGDILSSDWSFTLGDLPTVYWVGAGTVTGITCTTSFTVPPGISYSVSGWTYWFELS